MIWERCNNCWFKSIYKTQFDLLIKLFYSSLLVVVRDSRVRLWPGQGTLSLRCRAMRSFIERSTRGTRTSARTRGPRTNNRCLLRGGLLRRDELCLRRQREALPLQLGKLSRGHFGHGQALSTTTALQDTRVQSSIESVGDLASIILGRNSDPFDQHRRDV